jgi:hypothetical protein
MGMCIEYPSYRNIDLQKKKKLYPYDAMIRKGT